MPGDSIIDTTRWTCASKDNIELTLIPLVIEVSLAIESLTMNKAKKAENRVIAIRTSRLKTAPLMDPNPIQSP